MKGEMDKRLAVLEADMRRLDFIEVPSYSDEQRALLIVEVFQHHHNSTDPDIQWRLGRITDILEEGKRRRAEAQAES